MAAFRPAPPPERTMADEQSTSFRDVKQLGLFAAIGSLGYVFWVVGGMEMGPQERALRDGSDIIIKTEVAPDAPRIAIARPCVVRLHGQYLSFADGRGRVPLSPRTTRR